MIGKLKLNESAALIKRSDILISPDSGSAHLAAAVGTKTITLFGPTDDIRWRPYGPKNKQMIIKDHISCAPCGILNNCKKKIKCMTNLKIEEIIKKIEEIL
jgi:heptosyltransferase II